MSILAKLYDHMAWADERALTSLRDMVQPPSQAMDLYAHVVAAEHVWLRRIEAQPPTYAVWPKLSFDECEHLARENRVAFRALADEATETGGQRLITYRNSSGVRYSTSLEDILLHVAQHGVYHRGQVALLVRLGGGVPQPTDYIVFTRQ